MNRYLPHTLALVFFVTSAVLLWLLLQRPAFDCDSCFKQGEVVKVVHDTIWPVKEAKTIINSVPKPRKVVAAETFTTRPVADGAVVGVVQAVPGVMAGPAKPPFNEVTALTYPCDSVREYYTDTTVTDTLWRRKLLKREIAAVRKFRITATNQVQGVMLSNAITYQDLTPIVSTTQTIARKERVKWYVGPMVIIPGKDLPRWGIGPETLLTIPKVGGIGYGYDVRNDAHKASFLALIRFKK